MSVRRSNCRSTLRSATFVAAWLAMLALAAPTMAAAQTQPGGRERARAALTPEVFQQVDAMVATAAPLEPNVNHHRTFFGGSAATLATLAAWAMTEEKLLAEKGLDVHLVIQRSTMEYLEPAATEVEAECHAPNNEDWDRFIRTIRRRGKARIDLAVELRAKGAHVGSFQGSFLALPVKPIY